MLLSQADWCLQSDAMHDPRRCRYTGRIFLHSRFSRWEAARGVNMNSTRWYSVDPISIKNFSAVCWLTGILDLGLILTISQALLSSV